jgi:hypothetical protein
MVSAPVSIQAAASIIIADSKTPGDIAKPVNVLDLFSIFHPPIPVFFDVDIPLFTVNDISWLFHYSVGTVSI